MEGVKEIMEDVHEAVEGTSQNLVTAIQEESHNNRDQLGQVQESVDGLSSFGDSFQPLEAQVKVHIDCGNITTAGPQGARHPGFYEEPPIPLAPSQQQEARTESSPTTNQILHRMMEKYLRDAGHNFNMDKFMEYVEKVQGDLSLAVVPPEINARGPSAIEAYNKALADGKTRVKRIPVMLIGQSRSGKTSVKKSLMGKPFDSNEASTVGVEVDPSYFKVSTEIWKTKQEDGGANSDPAMSYDHHLARLIFRLLKEEGTALKDSNVNSRFPKVSSVRENHSEETEAISHDDVPELPEDIAMLVTKLLKDRDNVEDEEEVYSVLWDFGGQSVYSATHPLFLTSQAIYVLAYNLSQNLDKAAIPVLKQGKTNADFLDSWMSSVASLASQDEVNPESVESEKLPKRLPPVFLVCTHADKPYGDVDSRKLALEIFGLLQTKPYSNHLFEDVFAVDNTKSGSGQECLEVLRLKKEIHAVATELPQMKVDIPIKWLKYEEHLGVLSNQGHYWIPLNEARQVAFEVCEIVSDFEFSTLLNFLHDQRILMHFSDTPKLNRMVILNLNWLIDVFTKVITVKAYDPKEKQFTKLWDKLEKTGILEHELLKHVWDPFINQQETVEGLIAIMEKFGLLCRWPFTNDSQEYLVPSMLMSLPAKEVLDLLASAHVASMFVRFDSGQVPHGLFPRLVLHFFQWCTEEWPNKLQPQLFHNFARFYTRSDGGCSVILVCHSTFIEVVVHSASLSDNLVENSRSKMHSNEEFWQETTDVKTCRSVRRQLGLVLNEGFCWLKHVKYEMCVCCTVCCHSGSVKNCRTHHEQRCEQEECLHLLSESELRNCQQPICLNSAVAGENKIQVQQFAPWFPFLDEQKEAGDERDGNISLVTAGSKEITSFKTDSLSEEVLSPLAQDVCLVWKALGKLLSISDDDLQLIEADNQGHYERCYRMLKKWTQVQVSPPTCEDLARALQSKPVERGDLAAKYCSDSKEVSNPIMDWSYKDGKPTEEEIFRLATDLQEENWKQFGRCLKLVDSVLYEIDHDHRGQLFEKIYAMLSKWKQCKGKDATYRDLAEGLERVKRNDLIRRYCCASK